MKIKLSHIAVATPEIKKVADRLKHLSLLVKETHTVESEKVCAAMIPVETSEHLRLELLEPTNPSSPIAKFLEKRPNGGLHHLAFEVEKIEQWEKILKENRFEVLAPGIRKGARGKVLFIHPKDMGGVLVELEEIA